MADDSAPQRIYTYDDRDELQTVSINFGLSPYDFSQGPQGQQVAYSHYPDGSRARMTLPGTNYGSTQVYQYAGVGRLADTYLAGEGWGFRYGYLLNGWLAQTQGVYAASATSLRVAILCSSSQVSGDLRSRIWRRAIS